MPRSRSFVAAMTLAAGLCACMAQPTPPPESSPGPTSTPSPTPPGSLFTPLVPSPAPSVTRTPVPVPFRVEVVPAEQPSDERTAIEDERVVFLVTVREGSSGRGDPLRLYAEAAGGEVDWDPGNVRPGDVAEVSVVPDPVVVDAVVFVVIHVERAGVTWTERRTVPVIAGEDVRSEDASALRDRFVDWLAAERPELGIDGATAWDGTIAGASMTDASRYLYFSQEWEMGLSWQTLLPPLDRARIYLRHRWDEMEPSLAFELASADGDDDPIEVSPPDSVFR